MVTNETAACDCPQVDPFPSPNRFCLAAARQNRRTLACSASALTGSSLGEESIPFQVFYQAYLFLK